MSIYAIADLHLSTLAKTNKSMEVFGRRWDNYIQRLKTNWTRLVEPTDTVIVPGDISWALSLEEAESDLKFVDALPGRKIFLKGNHDFWWSTMNKHKKFFEQKDIASIDFLFNNAYEVENIIVAGTRGWFYDEDSSAMPESADFEKLVNRETLRLRASLESAMKIKADTSAQSKEIVVFMHFPPVWNGKCADTIVDVLKEYKIKRVYFGHIHGNYSAEHDFTHEGIDMTIVSADFIEFTPKYIPQG